MEKRINYIGTPKGVLRIIKFLVKTLLGEFGKTDMISVTIHVDTICERKND